MIDQTALEQGNATYSEIVAEGKRLVDFLRAMHPQMTPRPVQHGVGSNWSPCSTRSEPPSVLRVRADCGGRLFAAKLAVVVHNLAHQLLNHLLPDDAILLARQFCDCDRVDDFICFLVVDFIPARCRSLRLARKNRRR